MHRSHTERGSTCTVRIDRAQFTSALERSSPPDIPRFEIQLDRFVRSQTSVRTYLRVRAFRTQRSGSQVFVQYAPAVPWLPEAKVTVIADDQTGLRRNDLERIWSVFRRPQLLLVEVAFDFGSGSGVNREFVLRFARFGRSQLRKSRDEIRFGTRKSHKLVRCYDKEGIRAFRIELEPHSSWLRRHHIRRLDAMSQLSKLLVPRHVEFVELDWTKLRMHLIRRGLRPTAIVEAARHREDSLHQVTDYLRRTVGIQNVHRLLLPMPINAEMNDALEEWARQWR